MAFKCHPLMHGRSCVKRIGFHYLFDMINHAVHHVIPFFFVETHALSMSIFLAPCVSYANFICPVFVFHSSQYGLVNIFDQGYSVRCHHIVYPIFMDSQGVVVDLHHPKRSIIFQNKFTRRAAIVYFLFNLLKLYWFIDVDHFA